MCRSLNRKVPAPLRSLGGNSVWRILCCQRCSSRVSGTSRSRRIAAFLGLKDGAHQPFSEIVRSIQAKAYDDSVAEDTYAAYCFYGDPLAYKALSGERESLKQKLAGIMMKEIAVDRIETVRLDENDFLAG
jgi:hypothetical protein